MTTRKTVVLLIAATSIALALLMWVVVMGSSRFQVILAQPLHSETEPAPLVPDQTQPARLTVHNATPEQLERLGEATMAFANADLEIPAAEIWFHADLDSCNGHRGFFIVDDGPYQIRICSSEIESVYEHELAHAWVTENVTEAQEAEFMSLRGLEEWSSHDVPWNERGSEWAAVVIQQGLNGVPLPPVLSHEAKSRLVSFEVLTGRLAPVLANWVGEREVPCADRPTDLSRLAADVSGRTCP